MSDSTVLVAVSTLNGTELARGELVEQLSAGVILRDAFYVKSRTPITNDDTGTEVFLAGKIVHECDGCPGTGVYHGAGRVENGVFIGFRGKCFRCRGNGFQSDADRKRNRYYDRRIRRVYA